MMDWIRSFLAENDFLSGGLLLGALGSGVVLARSYGRKLLAWLWKQSTISIEVRSVDAPFHWMVHWLDQQPYAKRARRLTVSLAGSGSGIEVPKGNGDVALERPRVVFSPSVGSHFFFHRHRLLWLQRDREPASKDNWRERETFRITLFGRSQDLLRSLLDDAYDTYAASVRQQCRVFLSVYSYWVPQGFIRPRSLGSVVLPGTEKEEMLADIRRFLASEDWYHEMGIPYRRGYLLHGVPGSGKTSLIAAIANAVQMHLYVVRLPGLTDNGLQELLHNVSAPRTIVLFEDIDGAEAAQSRNAKSNGNGHDSIGVTVSGLLNALDGVASRDGCITIMTTNRREALDPALTRPGRVDMELEFGYATADQARELYRRFYGDTALERWGQTLTTLPGQVSMAVLQEHFVRHRDDPRRGALLHSLPQSTANLKVL